MEILSHRYLTTGKSRQQENTLSQLNRSLSMGFNFFETDIRRLPNGKFYISHDLKIKITLENDAILQAMQWKESGARIALNIKELGYERELINFLKEQDVLENVFLFDFDIEFLDAEPKEYITRIAQMEPKLECAVRVSDHIESVNRAKEISQARIVWLDEFDGPWAKLSDIESLKSAGKTVYCIAPDLHGFSFEETVRRFSDFIAWDADGICTDYAEELKKIIHAQ